MQLLLDKYFPKMKSGQDYKPITPEEMKIIGDRLVAIAHPRLIKLVMKGDLPGVSKDDLHITLEDGTLRIEAEKKEEKAEDGETWYVRERHYGKYSRSMELPFRVAAEKISATLDKGVLEIKLPKAEEAKPKRISIHNGQKVIEGKTK